MKRCWCDRAQSSGRARPPLPLRAHTVFREDGSEFSVQGSGFAGSRCARVLNPELRTLNPKTPAYRAIVNCRRQWTAVVVFAMLLAPAAAQDTVYIAGSTGGRTKLTGRVLDYTGRELRLELAGGREQRFAAGQVLQIETQYGPRHMEADALLAQDRFDQALAAYRQAIDGEPRPWVQRQIIARVVRCYGATGQPDRAGEAFLWLIRSDPDTPYFDCIPLAWMPRPVASEQTARQWLGREEPAAVLLGASHLLSSASRPVALRRLSELAAGSDRRIAQLALAQTWRAEAVTAAAEQIDAWGRVIDQMPESLAAGPYFVLGRARLHRQQWEPAALALLRVAILYPQQRDLAARSLLEAGRSLQMLDRSEQALRLYRELIRKYPDTPAVAEAQSRMEAIQKDQ